MKLAIYGYPRSGTTMLRFILTRSLVRAGRMRLHQDLGEIFAPAEDQPEVFRSGEWPGEAWLRRTENTGMGREERFELFKQYAHQGYLVKVLTPEAQTVQVLPWLVQNGYEFIAIERSNPFEALCSWLIAWHHQQYHWWKVHEKPAYRPFEADMSHVMQGINYINWYYQTDIPVRARLVYDDIVDLHPTDVLRRCGLDIPGFEPKTKKIHSLADKLSLITNHADVRRLWEKAQRVT